MKLLLAAATQAEIQPFLDHLEAGTDTPGTFAAGSHNIDICITGVGMMAATFALTRSVFTGEHDFVLQAGIGGGLDPAVLLGSVVAVATEQLGDLGAEDHEAFLNIFDLGFAGNDSFPFTNGQLINPMAGLPFDISLPRHHGLTVNTVSGNRATIAQRYKDNPATIESMEGAALHYVCLQAGIPFLQVRSISNYITPRDRSSWQIGKAINSLNAQLIKWIDALRAQS